MSYDYKKVRKKVEKSQDKNRYEHTLGVAYTAAMLAQIHGADVDDALIAGLLHDCAKCIGHEERLKICKKNNLEVTEVEKRNPVLLHSKVGSFLAKTEYDIENQDILNAIQFHTTGRPGMSTLEKIIFISDYIEPGRKQAPNLLEIRKMAYTNLDQALIMVLHDTLAYLNATNKEIDNMTQQTYDYYAK